MAIGPSRLMFILAVSGSAIGLGNIWKFPYITGGKRWRCICNNLSYMHLLNWITHHDFRNYDWQKRQKKRTPLPQWEILGKEETGNGVWKIVGFI